MKLLDIYYKVKTNGLKWLIWRGYQELINPSFALTRKPIDYILSLRKILCNRKNKRVSDFLYAIYDLEISPITFNIVEFLCVVEIESEKLKKKGFVVVFVPKKEQKTIGISDYEIIVDEHSSNWRFDNIVVQTTRLHPKCKGIYILPNRDEVKALINEHDIYPELYDGANLRYADIYKFYRTVDRPGLFKGLRATAQGKKYISQYLKERSINKKIISIVIRNYGYDTARNSRLDEWAKFVSYLLAENYFPIVIPDTDNAFNKNLPFDEKYIFRDCCWNVGLRMALYESSYLTFSVLNGPGAIALFNPLCSCICMNVLPEGSIVTTLESYRKIGYEPGENWGFLTSKQKLCLLPDTYDNIKNEFDNFVTKQTGQS